MCWRAIFMFVFWQLPCASLGKKLPDIYWNSTSHMRPHYAALNDQVDMHCPTNAAEFTRPSEVLRVYRVPEKDYRECRLSSEAKLVMACTSSNGNAKATISFRRFSANPSALFYEPGNTYYFISTSDGSNNGMDNTSGGLCALHGLKWSVHVVHRDGDIPRSYVAGEGFGRHPHHRHHHKHHQKPLETTTAVREEPMQNVDRFMLDNIMEKLGPEILQVRDVYRPQRVVLDTPVYDDGRTVDKYDSEALSMDAIDFQIHEIGEVELWGSSSRGQTLSLAFLLVVLIHRLL